VNVTESLLQSAGSIHPIQARVDEQPHS
jgi:hypothetical protein